MHNRTMTNRVEKSQGVPNIVAQFSKPAVSPISKSARCATSSGPLVWKPATRADLFATANPSGGGEVCATARRPDFGSIGFRRGIGLRNASHYERQRQSLYPGPFTRSG